MSGLRASFTQQIYNDIKGHFRFHFSILLDVNWPKVFKIPNNSKALFIQSENDVGYPTYFLSKLAFTWFASCKLILIKLTRKSSCVI